MTVTGGLRARLIHDSVYRTIEDAVTALGWKDLNRRHEPVTFRPKEVPFDEQVPFNTVAVSAVDAIQTDSELGSNYSEDTWSYYVDLYAQDDAVGTHLIHDIRDILRGKMASIGRTRPNIPVYDYSQATPVVLFYVDVENVLVDRANEFPKPWQKHWFVCQFDVVDEYDDNPDD